MLERSDLLTTTMTDINLLRVLENGIRNGKPLLIEDVHESIEPALEPVLAKAIFVEGNRRLIRLGDSNVDYDDEFRLFMTSKMPNPHYLPEVCIKVTIINFTVTLEGLEDQVHPNPSPNPSPTPSPSPTPNPNPGPDPNQLLGLVVREERPDLEKQKNNLVISLAADKKQLKERPPYLAYISPTSPLHLAYISPIPPLHLPYISPASPLHLPHISPTSPRYLPCISPTQELEDKILRLLSASEGNILDDEVLINLTLTLTSP